MSESEMFEIQGRTLVALKTAKSRVATVKAALSEQTRILAEAAQLLAQFSATPDARNAAGIGLAGHLKERLAQIRLEAIAKLVDDLESETARVAELQSQVDAF